jgi:hypothetical protein
VNIIDKEDSAKNVKDQPFASTINGKISAKSAIRCIVRSVILHCLQLLSRDISAQTSIL